MRSSFHLSAISSQPLPFMPGRRSPVPGRLSSLLTRLADMAEHAGWRQAALEVLGDEPRLLRYVGDERSADWRFLLPELPAGEVLCVGGALSPVPLALARTCRSVAVRCETAEGRFLLARARQEGIDNVTLLQAGSDQYKLYDLVAALRSPFNGECGIRNAECSELTHYSPFPIPHSSFLSPLPASVRQVKPGGVLYIEIDAPALFNPPALLRPRLVRLGFREVRAYWPRPGFDRCEALFPLGDLPLQRYYLDRQFFVMSPARRALRRLLKIASNAGLFELTLPGYMVVASRPERARS